MDASQSKVCSVCNLKLPLNHFSKNGKNIRTYCKVCQIEKAKPCRVRIKEERGIVQYTCKKCNKPFERWLMRSRPNPPTYCSSHCFPRNPRKAGIMSPFIRMATSIRIRCERKNLNHNIDALYLYNLWNEQEGVCPISGWKLSLVPGGKAVRDKANPIQASVDRIKQELGYIKGNVRFISLMANFARHTWGDADLIKFCLDTAKKSRKE